VSESVERRERRERERKNVLVLGKKVEVKSAVFIVDKILCKFVFASQRLVDQQAAIREKINNSHDLRILSIKLTYCSVLEKFERREEREEIMVCTRSETWDASHHVLGWYNAHLQQKLDLERRLRNEKKSGYLYPTFFPLPLSSAPLPLHTCITL
jgi:hypothetical protein